MGRTQKSILARIDQHKENIRNKNGATSFATAAIFEKWVPQWDQVEVLARPKTLMRTMITECIEIRSRRKHLVNSVELSDRFEVWRRAASEYN